MTAYQRIADTIRRQLLNGHWQPGQQIPTERELRQRFGASQITVRRAMQILEQEHLIERRQGAGTFATLTATRKIPIINTDYFDSISRHAPEMKRRLHSWRWDTADSDLANILQRCQGDSVLRAMRIDVLRDHPIAVDDIAIARDYAESLGEDDLARLDFVDRWQSVQKIRLGHCSQCIEAVKAKSPFHKLLEVPSGDPLLKETSLLYLSTNQPAGVFVTYYRHDCFRFEVTFDLDTNKMGDRA